MTDIFSQGQAVVGGTELFDVDSGLKSEWRDADLQWDVIWADNAAAPKIIHAELRAENGALLAHLGSPDFDSVSLDTLRAQEYSDAPLPGSNDGENKMTPGSVIAVKTNHGRYAKILINAYGYNLNLNWVTFTFTDAGLPAVGKHEVAIDPMALILPPNVYAKWVEGRHPHTPEQLERLLRGLPPAELPAIRKRAAALRDLSAVTERLASKVRH
jgi:hypothetical protein